MMTMIIMTNMKKVKKTIYGNFLFLHKKNACRVDFTRQAFIHLGFNTNPKNGRVKALAKRALTGRIKNKYYLLNKLFKCLTKVFGSLISTPAISKA